MIFHYDTISNLIQAAKEKGKSISALVLEQQAQQMEGSEQAIYNQMSAEFQVMKTSIVQGLNKDLRSASGLTGGSAYIMQQYTNSGRSLCGNVFAQALTYALAVSELNASMGRIVASPTAGSCGIIPAALITIQNERNLSAVSYTHLLWQR